MDKKKAAELIKKEYAKCAINPVYFLKNYCYIQHPKRGRILFKLYPFQEKVLTLFHDNENIIVNKSRQLGISTLAAGYSLWLMLFHKDKTILTLATTQATARNIVTKVVFMYDQLPKFLRRIESTEKNKLSLRLTNGSKIVAKSSNTDSARSEAASLLLIDEAAFIDNIEETYTAAQQTLATGGASMVLSTPNGKGGWFYKMFTEAEKSENSFVPIRLPWTVHPERDKTWRDEQDRDLGPRMASQECDANFLASGDGVFLQEDLDFFRTHFVQEPKQKRGIDGNLWVWKDPDFSREYVLVSDVARGDGEDYSSFHVVDIEANEQVAEYKGQLNPVDLGNLIVAVATEYNDAIAVVENANIGWATLEQLINRNYKNIYYSAKNPLETVETYMQKYENDRLVPGFTNSVRTRPLMFQKLEEYVRERAITIRSLRTIMEMEVFIWRNGKMQAQKGFNDDLVLPLSIYTFIRETALKYAKQGQDAIRTQLGAFSTYNNRNNGPVVMSSTNGQNPYKMKTNYGEEDLNWLIG